MILKSALKDADKILDDAKVSCTSAACGVGGEK